MVAKLIPAVCQAGEQRSCVLALLAVQRMLQLIVASHETP